MPEQAPLVKPNEAVGQRLPQSGGQQVLYSLSPLEADKVCNHRVLRTLERRKAKTATFGCLETRLSSCSSGLTGIAKQAWHPDQPAQAVWQQTESARCRPSCASLCRWRRPASACSGLAASWDSACLPGAGRAECLLLLGIVTRPWYC